MTDVILFFDMHPIFFFVLITLFFLIIGSFLNVVIHRLPIMMHARYEEECREFLTIQTPSSTSLATHSSFHLAWPPSHCPHCKHSLRPWHNIPILSFLLQKGRCAFCKHPISYQYPFIEALTLIASYFCIARFGWSIEAVFSMIFTYFLICLSAIDFRHFILPDELTLFLLWIGLLLSTFSIFCSTHDAIWGAAIAYLLFRGIQCAFECMTGKIGLGQGDHKLLAALAAFTGWQLLPILLLIAAALGLLNGLLIFFRQYTIRNQPIPFGPALAFSGWVCLLNHDYLLQLYAV